MYFKRKGLRKAISTVAKVCMPIVFENRSIQNPSKKAEIRSADLGVSKGSNIINRT
jgi:hypothetical protein